MLMHPQWDPIALSVGPLSIHWYGVSYLLAFALFLFLANRRLKTQSFLTKDSKDPWTPAMLEDLLFFGVLGVIFGGRIGYCFFYKPMLYLEHPEQILFIWQGGMSFHGGMIGVILAMVWWAHLRRKKWLEVTDLIAPCVPTGLASGRVGNFINGELWGRQASEQLPWAMVFPQSGTWVPRHPSQIYQFLLEGLLLFTVLWFFSKKERPMGAVSGVFLLGYGLCRFVAEYFREPDAFLGLLAGGLSMGQWLCVPMMLLGVVLCVHAYRQQAKSANH